MEGASPIAASALFALTEPSAPALTLVPSPAEDDTAEALAELRHELTLTGHRETEAGLRLDGQAEPLVAQAHDDEAAIVDTAVPTTPPADAVEQEPSVATLPLRVTAQLERARAESEVLSARVEQEQAARAEVERRLADAQDELRFLRAEIQMVGQTRRRSPGRIRRALRVVTFRRRAVVPAGSRKIG